MTDIDLYKQIREIKHYVVYMDQLQFAYMINPTEEVWEELMTVSEESLIVAGKFLIDFEEYKKTSDTIAMDLYKWYKEIKKMEKYLNV